MNPRVSPSACSACRYFEPDPIPTPRPPGATILGTCYANPPLVSVEDVGARPNVISTDRACRFYSYAQEVQP